MKCPFRKDEKGEFRDCYKNDCLAYCEVPEYDYTTTTNTGFAIKSVTPVCRMMGVSPYPVNCGGCA